MKIGKYPVKRNYKIARLLADVFSVGLAILIFSVTRGFFEQYALMLQSWGQDTVEMIVAEYDPWLVKKQWFALVFPILTAALFIAYIVLTNKSHPFKRYNVTKYTAQSCCDTYTFCVSLCKIPILLAIFDVMVFTENRMVGNSESPFSIQPVLDAILVAVIICWGKHRIKRITAAPPLTITRATPEDSGTAKVRIKPVTEQEEKK